MVTFAFVKLDYTNVWYRKNGYYTIVRYIYLWRPKIRPLPLEPFLIRPFSNKSLFN